MGKWNYGTYSRQIKAENYEQNGERGKEKERKKDKNRESSNVNVWC